MAKITQKQRDLIEVIRAQLGLIKESDMVSTPFSYKDIDKLCHDMMTGAMQPQIEPKHADRLSDIFYELISLIRDVER